MAILQASCVSRKAFSIRTSFILSLFIATIAMVFTVRLATTHFTETAPTADRLKELVKVIGLDTTFDHMAASVKSGMKRPTAAASADDAAHWEKILAGVDPAADAAYAPEALQRALLRVVDGKLTDGDLDIIIAFYKTPLGEHMTAVEKARDIAGPEAPQKHADELMEELHSQPDRAEALRLLERAMQLAEGETDRAVSVNRAVALGMAAVDDRTTSLSVDGVEALDQALQTMRPALAIQVREQIMLTLAYTYRDASVAELRQYLAFLKSPVGKKFYAAVEGAMKQVLLDAGEAFGHALMRELGKERV